MGYGFLQPVKMFHRWGKRFINILEIIIIIIRLINTEGSNLLTSIKRYEAERLHLPFSSHRPIKGGTHI